MTSRTGRTVDVLNTDRVRLLKEDPEAYYARYPLPKFGFDVLNADSKRNTKAEDK